MGTQLPDLDTRSVLHVVEENFKEIRLKSFATRMIYIGEHTLTRDEFITHMHSNIRAVNINYCDIKVNGLLLVYDTYFLHILEGSEETIYRHLRFLFQSEQEWISKMNKLEEENAAEAVGLSAIIDDDQKTEKKMFKRLKIVMVYECIKTLMFHKWRSVIARPPSLIGKLEVFGPMQEHLEQLRICLTKIDKLCSLEIKEPKLSFDGLSANDPKMGALPEVALMDFLLQSPYILDLREVASMHRRVDDHIFYFEQVWPLPTHFTPRQLYKLKIDDSFVQPLPVMPWEKVKEEEEGDRDPDEVRESSDSD